MKKKYYWIIGVLLFFIYLGWHFYECSWYGTCGPLPMTLEKARENSCQISKCSIDTNSIIVEKYDANKDGNIDSSDTLLELCKNHYNITTDSDCKKIVCRCS